MDKTLEYTQDWNIIFRKSRHNHWIFKWLDPYFQHCYAVRESEGKGLWIVVEGKNAATEVYTLTKQDFPDIRMIEPDGVILPIKAIIDPKQTRWSLCLFTCVDVCKSVLGIKDFWCWTPYQLYKRLSDGR